MTVSFSKVVEPGRIPISAPLNLLKSSNTDYEAMYNFSSPDMPRKESASSPKRKETKRTRLNSKLRHAPPCPSPLNSPELIRDSTFDFEETTRTPSPTLIQNVKFEEPCHWNTQESTQKSSKYQEPSSDFFVDFNLQDETSLPNLKSEMVRQSKSSIRSNPFVKKCSIEPDLNSSNPFTSISQAESDNNSEHAFSDTNPFVSMYRKSTKRRPSGDYDYATVKRPAPIARKTSLDELKRFSSIFKDFFLTNSLMN